MITRMHGAVPCYALRTVPDWYRGRGYDAKVVQATDGPYIEEIYIDCDMCIEQVSVSARSRRYSDFGELQLCAKIAESCGAP